MTEKKESEVVVRAASISDAKNIGKITRAAFMLYKEDLHSNYRVPALEESADDIISDITRHTVYVAEIAGEIVGCIRFKRLSDELGYVYRFGVSPDINNTGIGSKLLSRVIDDCTLLGLKAIALHTNSRYYKLARYYYGKRFFVHSTATEKGYIRALFVKELTDGDDYDLSPAFGL